MIALKMVEFPKHEKSTVQNEFKLHMRDLQAEKEYQQIGIPNNLENIFMVAILRFSYKKKKKGDEKENENSTVK